MRFHKKHGSCIILEEENSLAHRIDGFCDGVVFSAEPISTHTYYNVSTNTTNYWCGALSMAITNQDPNSLSVVPKYITPYLTPQLGFWTTFVSEEYLNSHKRLTFYVTSDGDLRFVINELDEETAIQNLPITDPLWIVLDIYGCTTEVKFIQEDEAPLEVYVNGPEAIYNYNIANNTGSIATYRTRLMLIGNNKEGKKFLKTNLMNAKESAVKAKQIEGLEVSGNYVMKFESLNSSSQPEFGMGDDVGAESKFSNKIILTTNVESTFCQCLAKNLVRGVLSNKKKSPATGINDGDVEREASRRPISRGAWKNSAVGERQPPKRGSQSFTSGVTKRRHVTQAIHDDFKDDIIRKYLNELPEEVAFVIQQLLHDTETKQLLDQEDNEKKRPTVNKTRLRNSEMQPTNVTYSVWDVDSENLHHDLLQFVFSPRAIYLLAFDLDNDINGNTDEKWHANLEEILYWINCIHAYATPSVVPVSGYDSNLSPPVIIVGTYQKSISDNDTAVQDKQIEEKLMTLQDRILDKPFYGHVVTPFFALPMEAKDRSEGECDIHTDTQEMLTRMQNKLQEVLTRQPYYGEEISIKWLLFEESIQRLVDNHICHTDLRHVHELARAEGIETEEGQRALLSFYHDIGLIMHFGGVIGTQNGSLMHTVILDSLWLIDSFNSILRLNRHTNELRNEQTEKHFHDLETHGILDEALVDLVWKDAAFEEKSTLLEMMTRLDLLCQKSSRHTGALIPSGQYYLPSQISKSVDYDLKSEAISEVFAYFLDFLEFLPDGLFHRLIIRTVQWTQDSSGKSPTLFNNGARFSSDDNTEFTFHIQPHQHNFIKVSIFQKHDSRSNADLANSTAQTCLSLPHACAKIRNFLESTLADLRELWMKRLAYRSCIACPCEKVCIKHQQKSCQEPECKHFLSLDDCLVNNIVFCEYRKINTSFIRKRFPKTTIPGQNSPILPEGVVMKTVNNETVILESGIGMVMYQRPKTGLDAHNTLVDPRIPICFRNISRILNSASEGRDWAALAESLGYRPDKMTQFNDDLNPGLAVITDWLFNSGNTYLSVDMLISCLKKMGNHEAANLLNEMQDEREDTPIFVSYQWDTQDDVLLIRTRLEQYGLRCWMDIGQMGGGDLLYNRIYRGISRAKVILACITPKYVVSHNCTREASLADLLGKPIIPVMVYPTPWPPPGPLAVLFSQLVYIDMCGIGGHGGSGYHADWEDRIQEILSQIYHYVAPVYHRIDPPPKPVTTSMMLASDFQTQATTESMNNFVNFEVEESSLNFPADNPLNQQSEDQDDDFIPALDRVEHNEAENAMAGEEEIDSHREESNPSVAASVQANVTKCSVCTIL